MNATATPTPTPFDPAATAANVALSNYYLAIILIVAAIIVILIALGFAWMYHRKALEVIMSAVSRGAQVGSPADGGATTLGSGPRIVGPSSAAPSEELFFGLADVDPGKTVAWTAEGGTPSASGERTFTTAFADEGEYVVEVQIEEPQPLTKTVTVGTPAVSGSAPIVIPFVLKNWGRLVVVLFGVGVIAALMATTVISAEAGIGILGALLGVGATAAASGGGGGGGNAGNAGTPPPSPPTPDTGSVLGQRGKN